MKGKIQWTMMLVLVWGGISLCAQPSTASFESLAADRDSNDVLFLLKESTKFEGEQATNLAEQAVYIAKIIKFDRGADLGYERLIQEYQRRGETPQVLRTRLQLGNYLKEKGRHGDMLDNVMRLGELYLQNKIYTKAATAYLEADTISERHQLGRDYDIDKHLAYAAQNAGLDELAWKHYRSSAATARQERRWTDLLWILQQEAALSHQTKQYGKAFDIHRDIYRLADSLGNEGYRATAMNNLGVAAKYAGRNAEAITFLNDALKDASTSKNLRLQAQLFQSLGILHQILQDYKTSIIELRASADRYQRAAAYQDQARVTDFLALVLYQNAQAYEALVAVNAAIDQSTKRDYPDVLQASFKTRATIYESLHEYEAALADYKRHLHIDDSLRNVERRRQDNILQQQFILERMEKELKLFYINEEIKDKEADKLRFEREAAEERYKGLQKDSANNKLVADQALKNLELERRQRRLQQQTAEINNLNLEQERQRLLLDAEKLRADSVRQANVQLGIEKERQDFELENQRLRLDQEALKLSEEQARSRNLFLLIGGLALVLLVIFVILLQLRSKNRRIHRQNEVILENQRIISIEKEKSEALLLNILPSTVAAELKEKGSSTPRHYDAVTVLFTDFVGFTMISERMTPTELIATLDKVFLEFDLICERHGLSRIKTIGDSYMAVAGLPEPHPNHAENAVRAALEMVAFIQRFNAAIADPALRWNARVGLNSGPVVAGVVGIKKFAYDIWGDTVNTASRMESSGEPGRVNISGATHALVSREFTCEYRGKVSAKNKGDVDMYFVSA